MYLPSLESQDKGLFFEHMNTINVSKTSQVNRMLVLFQHVVR